VLLQVVQGVVGHLPGQVAGDPEDDERVRLWVGGPTAS
jgi:hypothetical protein